MACTHKLRAADQRAYKVRYTSDSDAIADLTRGPSWLRVGKGNLHAAALVGAAMCSAFECGTHDRWP